MVNVNIFFGWGFQLINYGTSCLHAYLEIHCIIILVLAHDSSISMWLVYLNEHDKPYLLGVASHIVNLLCTIKKKRKYVGPPKIGIVLFIIIYTFPVLFLHSFIWIVTML
jgi:hypothetical protein